MRPSLRIALPLVIALALGLLLMVRARARPSVAAPEPAPGRAATARPTAREPERTEAPLAPGIAKAAATKGGATAPGTTLVVVKAAHEGLTLVSFADKDFAWPGPEAAGPGASEARARIEDGAGRVLLETTCSVPRLCRCAIGRDHAQGCGVIRHEAVFRMKLPRLAARERVVLLAADGSRELGRFDIGRTP